MNITTKVYLKKKFKDYYSKHRVAAPDDIEKREFGVGTLEKKIVSRHKQFKSEYELGNCLRLDAPFYISYSVAYYEFPKNPMGTKNWLGADLVFDIDVPVDLINYKNMERAKDETQKLIEFLRDDFDFKKKDLEINFSGNKGYHIHVSTPGILKLGKDERREIVDHITGTGLDLRLDSSWRSRIVELIKHADIEELERISGVGRNTAEKIMEKKGNIIKQLEKGVLEGVEGVREKTIQGIGEGIAVRLTGDVDKMVTIDTSRLIRLPDSLHGSSGLAAMKTKNIEKFDPLNDAVAFSDKQVKVKVTKNAGGFELKDQTHGPYDKDAVLDIPEYAGIYLMLKDYAEVVG